MTITNYTINLDKLELMLKAPEKQIIAPAFVDTFDDPKSIFDLSSTGLNLFTIDEFNAKPHYKYKSVDLYRVEKVAGRYKLQYDILIKDKKLGNIRMLPTNNVKFFNGKTLISLTIDNKLLYTDDVYQLVTEFLTVFDLEINNFTRFDIALDSNVDSNEMLLDLFYDDTVHFMSRNRLINNITEVSTLYRNGTKTASFYVGKEGDLQVNFYNKTKQTGKYFYYDYQRNFHDANGLNISDDVYRVEIRVPRKALKHMQAAFKRGNEVITPSQYNNLTESEKLGFNKVNKIKTIDIDLATLTNKQTLQEIYRHFFESLIDFRLKDKANKDRCTHIDFIDFGMVKSYAITNYIKETEKMDNNLIKKDIKDLLNQYKRYKKSVYYHDAYELAVQHELIDYFTDQKIKFRVEAPGGQVPYNYVTPNRPTLF